MEHIPVMSNYKEFYPNGVVKVIGPPPGLEDQVEPADMIVDQTDHGPVFRGFFVLDKEELEQFKDGVEGLVFEVAFWGNHLHPFGAKIFKLQQC